MKKLNSNGFAISPFFIVVLIFLGTILIVYFYQTDLEKVKSIKKEGQVNQAILDMEELKVIVKTLTLFLSYQSAFEIGEKSGEKNDLEKEIEKALNDYFKNYTSSEGITAKGNFSLFIVENPKGDFYLYVNKTPLFQMNKSGIEMNLSFYFKKLIDIRFFLLENFSREMNKSHLANLYTEELRNQLVNEFAFNLSNYTLNDKIILKGVISNNSQANNGSKIKKIFEEALIALEKNSSSIFPEIVNESCVITFLPHLIIVSGDKEIFENNTYWQWQVNISLIAKIFDYSTLQEIGNGEFKINVVKGIILKNGSLMPLSYKVKGEKTSFFYNISVMQRGIDGREFNNYTQEMFNTETHLPTYIWNISH